MISLNQMTWPKLTVDLTDIISAPQTKAAVDGHFIDMALSVVYIVNRLLLLFFICKPH